eukprot:7805771-Pyramimonas_sp.AAC.1
MQELRNEFIARPQVIPISDGDAMGPASPVLEKKVDAIEATLKGLLDRQKIAEQQIADQRSSPTP